MASFLEGLAEAALGGTAAAAQTAVEDWRERAKAAREAAYRKEGWEAEMKGRKELQAQEMEGRRQMQKEEMQGRQALQTQELAGRREIAQMEAGSRSADRAATREEARAARKEEMDFRKEMAKEKAAGRGDEVKSVTRVDGEMTEGSKVLTTYQSGKQSIYDPKTGTHTWLSAPGAAGAAPAIPDDQMTSEGTKLGLSGVQLEAYKKARAAFPDDDPQEVLAAFKASPQGRVYFPD